MADIIIIGGGIAGCMAAHQLQHAGADVLLIERHAEIASEASGNPYGLVMPQLSVGKSAASEFNALAYTKAIQFYETCGIEKHPGILQCAVTEEDETRFEKLAAQSENKEFFKKLDAEDASDCLGLAVHRSALWFPKALTVAPKELCRYLTRDIPKKFSTDILSVQPDGKSWIVKDKNNCMVASAEKIVLANALDALRFPGTAHLPLRARRGQLSFVPANDKSRQIRTGFTFGGYMTRTLHDMHVLGATYEQLPTNPAELTSEEHKKNLTKLHAFLPGLFSGMPAENLSGRAAIRTTTPDHLPIGGAIPDYSGLYILTGLGSRGLTTAHFCAEELCKTLLHETDGQKIITPQRFEVKTRV